MWLEIWAKSPIQVDRKGRKEPAIIAAPFVCVTGSIQPGILSELKDNREDGFLDRFLLSYPDSVPNRYTDDEISDEAIAGYRKLYDRLFDLEMPLDRNGEPAPVRIEMSPRAKEVFADEYDSLSEERERPSFPYGLKGHWGKYPAHLARIALILAVARIAESECIPAPPLRTVTEKDMRAAVSIVAYFKAHARRVYGKLHGEKPGNLLREALKHFVRENGGYWEGTTKELHELLEARSSPGLPGGSGPLGKDLRRFEELGGQDLKVRRGHRGPHHIVKLSSGPLGGTTGGNGAKAQEPVTTEGTEGNVGDHEDAEKADIDVVEDHGSAEDEKTQGSTSTDLTEYLPQDEVSDTDRGRVEQIIEVLAQQPNDYIKDAIDLVDEGFFYDKLDFDPTKAEVTDAQYIFLGVKDETP